MKTLKTILTALFLLIPGTVLLILYIVIYLGYGTLIVKLKTWELKSYRNRLLNVKNHPNRFKGYVFWHGIRMVVIQILYLPCWLISIPANIFFTKLKDWIKIQISSSNKQSIIT